MPKINTKTLTFTAICIALAVILHYVKAIELPFGGSITLFSMFFLTFIGYLFGPVVGIMGGLAYGLLRLALGAHIYYPAQAVLDYPVAFAVLGFSGFLANRKHGLFTGYVLGGAMRFIVASVSGYVFFRQYAPENMNPIIYTLQYNASYIVPEMVLTVAVLLVPPVRHAIGRIKSYSA